MKKNLILYLIIIFLISCSPKNNSKSLDEQPIVISLILDNSPSVRKVNLADAINLYDNLMNKFKNIISIRIDYIDGDSTNNQVYLVNFEKRPEEAKKLKSLDLEIKNSNYDKELADYEANLKIYEKSRIDNKTIFLENFKKTQKIVDENKETIKDVFGVINKCLKFSKIDSERRLILLLSDLNDSFVNEKSRKILKNDALIVRVGYSGNNSPPKWISKDIETFNNLFVSEN